MSVCSAAKQVQALTFTNTELIFPKLGVDPHKTLESHQERRADKSAAGRDQGPVPADLCATGQVYR